jgi:hypothetical protein
MIDAEILEQFQLLVSMIEKLPTKEYVEERITKRISETERHLEIMIVNEVAVAHRQLAAKIDESRRHTEILIENTITKRLDSLNDGYKLTHEKQFELERKNEALQAKIEMIEQRLFALENKTA